MDWAGLPSGLRCWFLNQRPKGKPMKRDMDIVRRIALATADMPYGQALNGIEGVAPEVFVTHVVWMQEAGLVEAATMAGSGSLAMYANVNRLTWDGCEFADAIQSDTLWAKAKEHVLVPGISFTFDVLKDWLKTEIAQGLPTLRKLGQ